MLAFCEFKSQNTFKYDYFPGFLLCLKNAKFTDHWNTKKRLKIVKDPHSYLIKFLTVESPLKIMKNVFYFMLKALFVLEMFTFLSWLFRYVEKRLDKTLMINFKFSDVTDWTTNIYNTHTTQYLKTLRQSGNKVWSVNKL